MSRPQNPIWLFLVALTSLFVFSVTTPRSWRKISHRAAPSVARQVVQSASKRSASKHSTPKRSMPPAEATLPMPLRSAPPLERQPLASSEPLGKVMSLVEREPDDRAPDDREPAIREELAEIEVLREAPVDEVDPEVEIAPNRQPLPSEPTLAPPLRVAEPAAAPEPRIAIRERTRPEPPALTAPASPRRSKAAQPKSAGNRQARSKRARNGAPRTPEAQPAFWQTPEVLMANLDRLSLDCEATEWATRTGDLIRELCRQAGPATPRAAEIIDELQRLAVSQRPLERPLADPRAAAALGRIQHALMRHVEIWRLTPELAQHRGAAGSPTAAEHGRLAHCVAEVAALTSSDPAGESWREYLQLGALDALARQRLNEQAERDLARRVLEKLERAAFDERQRQFIASSPLSALDRQLHRWIAEPVDPRQLLTSLERFEESGSPSDALELARLVRRVADGPGPVAAQAQSWLDAHYRNSNLRVAITAELLNRLVPRQDPIEAPVRDRILGVPTHGWSRTTADLGVRLIPDPHRVRVALEVQGQVRARTTSRSGPATFYSHSDAEYLARKEIIVGLAGVHTQPAEADASNTPQLQDVETDYDNVPLLGLVIEAVARVKHAEQEGALRRISRQRVASRVQEELDAAVESKLKQANQQFQARVLAPLRDLSLEPTVAAMRTSEERITLRARVASDEQLAACTPRPQALADSLASVQIHQSLLNNVGQRLQLDGRSFALPELQKHLAQILGLDASAFSEEYPSDMRIEFAPRDAVQVRFVNGRVEITLAVAELWKRPSVWHDFQVRAYYKPVRQGLDLRLVRDGTVQLWGERFGAQPQIALRGIFSRVFSQERQLALVDPKLARDSRLAGLAITQCVVTDGWIGISLGPQRSPRTARKP